MNTVLKLVVPFMGVWLGAMLYWGIGSMMDPRPMWEQIAAKGGERVKDDLQGHPCWYYPKDRQEICYRVWETWYGQDAEPWSIYQR